MYNGYNCNCYSITMISNTEPFIDLPLLYKNGTVCHGINIYWLVNIHVNVNVNVYVDVYVNINIKHVCKRIRKCVHT